MSENRKQHFIPRLYLRNFSFENDNKTIGIYVIKSRKFTRGGIKNQCYSDYFYGEDLVVEKELSQLEGQFANVLRPIIDNHLMPKRSTDDYISLLLFVISLAQRTRYAVDRMNEMSNKVLQIAMKNVTTVPDALKEYFIDLEPNVMLTGLKQGCIAALDLCCKLMVNHTRTKFITSDNPIIKHNQYYSGEHVRGHNGLACRGLQIFLSISPDLCLMIYDDNVYRVGNRRDICIEINNPADVDEINVFQLMNADQVLYFNHQITEDYMIRLSRVSGIKQDDKIIVREYEAMDPDEKGILVQSMLPAINRNLKLSFVRLLKKAKRHPPSYRDRLERYRNPDLLQLLHHIDE